MPKCAQAVPSALPFVYLESMQLSYIAQLSKRHKPHTSLYLALACLNLSPLWRLLSLPQRRKKEAETQHARVYACKFWWAKAIKKTEDGERWGKTFWVRRHIPDSLLVSSCRSDILRCLLSERGMFSLTDELQINTVGHVTTPRSNKPGRRG